MSGICGLDECWSGCYYNCPYKQEKKEKMKLVKKETTHWYFISLTQKEMAALVARDADLVRTGKYYPESLSNRLLKFHEDINWAGDDVLGFWITMDKSFDTSKLRKQILEETKKYIKGD